MRRRRKSRILALCMLYGAEVSGDQSMGAARLTLSLFDRRFDQSIEDYAFHLVRGIQVRRAKLDALIRTHARNWSYTRMAVVDRQIMRIALWEMLYDRHMPAPICINEAIDIAKLYSTSESGHFINGILDNVHKHMNTGADVEDLPDVEPDAPADAPVPVSKEAVPNVV